MTPARAQELPGGLPVVLDAAVRRFAGDTVLLGGDPRRLLRLRPCRGLELNPSAARDAFPARRLVRTLVDGGLAHPRPHREKVQDLTVIVPVRDRLPELERCLSSLAAGIRADDAAVVVVDDGSVDQAGVLALCTRFGASVVRQSVNRGPAAARNTGLAATSTGLVAFLDSDCVVPAGWLEALVGHFRDPAVAAVAPRVRAAPGSTLLARYARARGPLDLGPWEARVRPGGRVPYVPTAALVVRRTALDGVLRHGRICTGQPLDPRLRYGEDVDLVWRLHDAGWTVRYDPRTVVEHAEPEQWLSWWHRRHCYGTSAAPLSARHGDRLAPMVVPPWPSAVCLLLLTGRPLAALAVSAVPGVRLDRRLRRAGVPAQASVAISTRTTVQNVLRTAAGAGGGGAVLTLPVLCLGLALRPTRRAAALALLAPPLLDAVARRPRIDPVTWTVLRVLDDLAYASGVWRGCWTGRTTSPLRPRRQRPETS